MKNKEREEYARQVLLNAEEIQQKKLEDYYIKQENIKIRKEEIKKMNEYDEIEKNERMMKLKLRQLNAQENNFKLIEEKNYKINKKIKDKAKSVENMLKIKQKENEKNILENKNKYNKVLNEYNIIKKIDKQKREEMAILLQEKSDKIDLFKQNKILENEKNAINKEIVNNYRREFELKFKKLYHEKKLDDEIENKILEIFPNNNKLINIVEQIKKYEHEEHINKRNKEHKKKLKEKDKDKEKNTFYNENNQINTNNNYQNNLNNNDININNDNYNDKEILILDSLNEFKINLNKELYEVIELEENNEKKRIELLNKCPQNKKEEIMSIIKEERKKFNEHIKKIIEENENKCQEYEIELKNKFL